MKTMNLFIWGNSHNPSSAKYTVEEGFLLLKLYLIRTTSYKYIDLMIYGHGIMLSLELKDRRESLGKGRYF